jgi:hypothetical protein
MLFQLLKIGEICLTNNEFDSNCGSTWYAVLQLGSF